MNVPDFYNPKDVEAFYSYDGDQYAVQEGNVFIRSGDKYVFTDSITLSQLELYAKKEELLSPLFELKVLAVKEHSDGSAFIKVTDNAGIDFTFIDSDYSKRRNNYVVGKIGKYRIYATITESHLPEYFKNEMEIRGEDVQKYCSWVGSENYCDFAVINLKDFACYKESKSFSKTAEYDFKAFVNNPLFTDFSLPESEKFSEFFELTMMNQFNRSKPRFVLTDFKNGHFPERIYENRKDDEDFDFMDGNFVIEGRVQFEVFASETGRNNEDEDFFPFDDNPLVPYEAKYDKDE